ncbi:MAG: PRC-barrel domain-containing protein [Candidatus Kerfeldbacteria bacterium]
MILKKQDIINLPVYTESSQHLGKIVDFEFESDTQTILSYYIRSGHSIKELLSAELIINREQVILITNEKMIVEDNILVEKEKKNIQKQAIVA